jgi:hypothetical protein
MDAARTVTATFASAPPPSSTLTVTRAGPGVGTVTSTDGKIACGSTCSADYAPNSQVTLKAATPTGSTFVGWSGACTGTGDCRVNMDAAKSVTAAFERSNVGVDLTRPPTTPPTGGPPLVAKLTARLGCGPIDRIQFGTPGDPFNNAKVTITSPAGGPSDRTTGFTYTPPPGTTSVSLQLQRVEPSGGATVNPIYLYDGCGEWRTFVGGGPNAFK